MSSSAPPQTGRIEPVRVLDDAEGIIAAKGALVEGRIEAPRLALPSEKHRGNNIHLQCCHKGAS